MFHVPVGEIVSCGPDWFAFSWAMNNDAIIGGCLDSLQTKCVGEGYARKYWGANGYKGWKTGAVAVGYRTEGGYCEATSRMALPVFLALQGTPGLRCSRIDFQVTVRLGEDDARLHQKVDAALRVAQAEGVAGAPDYAPSFGEDKTGHTIYLGSAQSDKRGRVYDKGMQSGAEIAGRWWRFEYQLRRRYAKAAYKGLCGVSQISRSIANTVKIWLAACGVVLDVGDGVGTGVMVGRRKPTTDEAAMAWVIRQVGPTLYRLLDTDQRSEAVRFITGLAIGAGLLDSVT